MHSYGDHDILVQGQVVTLTTASGFNGEGMKLAYRNLLTNTLDLGDWVLLIKGNGESGATPDALEQGAELSTLLPDIGCIGVVTLNRTLLMQDLAHHVFGPSGLPLCVTSDAVEAQAFIQELLAPHD